MGVTFLQANLNHSARAQDLLLQSMAEWDLDVAVVAEPYAVPSLPHWAGDLDGLVAIVARPGAAPPLAIKKRGNGFVVAVRGEYAIIGVYFSPNRDLPALERFLDALGPEIRRLAPLKVFVAGDFNAKSTAWGNPATEPKGRKRRTGGSVVDLTFATPSAARSVSDWRVEGGVETLSDHLYIRFEVSAAPQCQAASSSRVRSRFPRWAITRLDRELAEEAAIVGRWSLPPLDGMGVDDAADRLGDAFTVVCRAAMPSVGRAPPRRAVYWWSAEIAALRVACNAARRAYSRSRRRSPRDEERDGQLYAV
ncbi:uncharacterized protein LOC128669521, partial [Plodia interpunctella]|uniref:uncharacterized protein LOC128669521 n=1 Tax=Plodia interpunctella TaxID=58824 RepID=UPI0031010D16